MEIQPLVFEIKGLVTVRIKGSVYDGTREKATGSIRRSEIIRVTTRFLALTEEPRVKRFFTHAHHLEIEHSFHNVYIVTQDRNSPNRNPHRL